MADDSKQSLIDAYARQMKIERRFAQRHDWTLDQIDGARRRIEASRVTLERSQHLVEGPDVARQRREIEVLADEVLRASIRLVELRDDGSLLTMIGRGRPSPASEQRVNGEPAPADSTPPPPQSP